MSKEGFDQVEEQDITPEEFEAKLSAAPKPVSRMIRALQASHESVGRVAESIGESGDVMLMFRGMELMMASEELDAAFTDFLSFLIDRSGEALASVEPVA